MLNKFRYEVDVKDPQKYFIMLDEDWYKELMKYPYFSSKNDLLYSLMVDI